MPIVRNTQGHSMYVTARDFHSERPEDFFRGDYREFQKRIERARTRVLEAIRFSSPRPLSGRGTNHEVKIDSKEACIDQLVDFVDRYDGKRARERRRNGPGHGLRSYGRIRSPQDIKRRRSALFGGADIPDRYLRVARLTKSERDRFVELMRWLLIREAITTMWSNHELELVGNIWYVPVSVMDNHVASIKGGSFKKNHVKQDDRSFHGRPRRDRNRHAIAA